MSSLSHQTSFTSPPRLTTSCRHLSNFPSLPHIPYSPNALSVPSGESRIPNWAYILNRSRHVEIITTTSTAVSTPTFTIPRSFPSFTPSSGHVPLMDVTLKESSVMMPVTLSVSMLVPLMMVLEQLTARPCACARREAASASGVSGVIRGASRSMVAGSDRCRDDHGVRDSGPRSLGTVEGGGRSSVRVVVNGQV